MGAELFHAEGKTDGLTDGQTRMTKLIVAFRSLAEVPKKYTKAAQVCRHLTGVVWINKQQRVFYALIYN